MAEYVVFKRGSRVPERTVDRGAMLDRVETYLDKADQAKSWYRHRDPQRAWHAAEATRKRVANLTRDAKESWRVLVQRRGDDDLLVIQKVQPRESIVDLGCHPEIEKAHGLLWAKFGEDKLRSAGRWYCRYIDGTKTVSRHGYYGETWKGAAEDIFGEGSMNSMNGLTEIAHFLVRKHNEGQLKLYTVIYGDRKWRAGEGWGPYGGVFHTHVHVDTLGGGPCSP